MCSCRGSSAGHAEHLVVPALLVGHPEHADRPALDQAAGERRLVEQHQRVERVAVLTEGALDEAVVGRVAGRGEQHPVEPDPPGLVVDLVLVALTLGDLDGDVELRTGFARSAGRLVCDRVAPAARLAPVCTVCPARSIAACRAPSRRASHDVDLHARAGRGVADACGLAVGCGRAAAAAVVGRRAVGRDAGGVGRSSRRVGAGVLWRDRGPSAPRARRRWRAGP